MATPRAWIASTGEKEAVAEATASTSQVLYEKCLDCHLFVEPNDAKTSPDDGFAKYLHLHTGSAADEALDESHEATPSGQRANLRSWKAHGPRAMRERFTT